MKHAILFLFLCLLVNSCDLETDCEACQEAINHMAEKIADNSCNPANMQNAWDRIIKDCGAMGDSYVGYMAETCDYQNLGTPNCETQVLAVQSPEIACYTTTGLPGPVELTVHHSGSNGSENFVFDGDAQSDELFVEIPTKVYDGDEITFTIWEPGSNDVLATVSATFKFERNDQWFDLREIEISFKEGSDYSISLKNW